MTARANDFAAATIVLAVSCTQGCDTPSATNVSATYLVEGLAPNLDDTIYVPGCRTLVTDWGTCVESGVYEGDPVLLMGHHPHVNGYVLIDCHDGEAPIVSCPDGSAATVCLGRLPFGSMTITVSEGPL